MEYNIRCIDLDKQARKDLLFKMFCANCVITIDRLKEIYPDDNIPSITLKEDEDIFKLGNYVFVIKNTIDENNEVGFTINRDYMFKRKKDKGYWIKGNCNNITKKFYKELREYEDIVKFYYYELFDIIYSNGLSHRYILILDSDKRIHIYDNKENELTPADDIDNYCEFFLDGLHG